MTSVLRSTFWYPAGCSTMPLGFVYTPWICRTLSFLFSCAHSSTCTKHVPETLARADSSASTELLRGYSLLRSPASPVLGLLPTSSSVELCAVTKTILRSFSMRQLLFRVTSYLLKGSRVHVTACSGSLLHLFGSTLQLNG